MTNGDPASAAIPPAASTPPNDLPRYRLLTGPDDEHFCRRVSEALDAGFILYGSPSATHDGIRVIVAQAVVWPTQSRTEESSAGKRGA